MDEITIVIENLHTSQRVRIRTLITLSDITILIFLPEKLESVNTNKEVLNRMLILVFCLWKKLIHWYELFLEEETTNIKYIVSRFYLIVYSLYHWDNNCSSEKIRQSSCLFEQKNKN
jgi:hypothetical protein